MSGSAFLSEIDLGRAATLRAIWSVALAASLVVTVWLGAHAPAGGLLAMIAVGWSGARHYRAPDFLDWRWRLDTDGKVSAIDPLDSIHSFVLDRAVVLPWAVFLRLRDIQGKKENGFILAVTSGTAGPQAFRRLCVTLRRGARLAVSQATADGTS